MTGALYGDGGFYRAVGAPGRNFRTAAHTSAAWATAVIEVCRRADDALGRPDDFTVVDMGAGGGELISGIAADAPRRWRLLGVDVAARPERVPARIVWSGSLPGSFTGVLLAIEWLDVVPVDVVERAADGLRLVEVTRTGVERLGAEPSTDDLDWLERWWAPAEVGDRAEVGRPRDLAWADAVSRLSGGVAVAVDYGAVPARDVAGTLTGYRAGRQVLPVPDGSCDVTAHVLMQSCAAAAAADDATLLTQRDALHRLGLLAQRPVYDGDPASYLAGLSTAGAQAELLDPSGLGGFTWLVQCKGTHWPL
jgi:SAM-dependent MidA family methyltransferase